MQHSDTGQRQALPATGVSPPTLDIPERDNTTTQNPSVTNSVPENGTVQERMDIEDVAQNDLADQLASADLTRQKGNEKARPTSEQPAQETPTSADATMAGTNEAADEKELRKKWRIEGRPNCAQCGRSHPPPCRPEMVEEQRRLAELKTSNPDEYNRQMAARTAARKQQQEARNREDTEKVHARMIAAGKTPNKLKSADERPERVNFADSVEYPQGKTTLPPNFCLQCLACHPVRSGKGTYHIRTFQKNLELHSAISAGDLPKVKPFESIAKEFKPPSPKPTPAQAQQQQTRCLGNPGNFTATRDTGLFFGKLVEGRTGMESVQMLNSLMRGDDEFHADQRRKDLRESAKQESEAQQRGSYAAAATTGGYSSHFPLATEPRPRSPQPTGPPLKKKRKAGETDEGSGRAVKGAKVDGAQRKSAAQTSQPTTNSASNTDEGQRPSSNSLDNVQHTSQTKSLTITNVPTTSAPTKPIAKGEATAAKEAAEQTAAKKAGDDAAAAKKAAPNSDKPT